MKQYRFYIVYVLIACAAFFISFHEDIYEPVAKPLAEIPQRLAEWSVVDETRFSEAVLKQLRPTDYLYRVYAGENKKVVSLYLGYHGGGPESGPIHSPKHCLPGGGWTMMSEQVKTHNVGGVDLPIVESVYQKDGQRELFLYWFQVKGRVLTNEYRLKFAEITNSIFNNRRDSAFIRISVPYREGDVTASKAAETFFKDFYPYIKDVLPQ